MLTASTNRGFVSNSTAKRIVGLGELVWDIFPDGERLGGAPANVAMHSAAFGNMGILATAVGVDELGRRAIDSVSKRGVDTKYVQQNRNYPTGTVQVELRGESPVYTIEQNVAWAHLRWNDDWATLFANADAVAFGTILQHTHAGRHVLAHAKSLSHSSCVWLLDLNLRPSFVSHEAIIGALQAADVLKLSEDEAEWLQQSMQINDLARWCFETMNMKAVAVTRGANGSRLITPKEDLTHPGYPAAPGGDPVGAGDAFTSALLYHLLRKSPMERTLDHANRYASWIASQRGAVPEVPRHLIQQVTA